MHQGLLGQLSRIKYCCIIPDLQYYTDRQINQQVADIFLLNT